MTKKPLRRILFGLLSFSVGMAVGSLLVFVIYHNMDYGDGENKNVDSLQVGCTVVKALHQRDYDSLQRFVGAEGLRFVAFSTISDSGDQIFTKEQVKAFAKDKKTYIFGIDATSGLVIERQPAEFITEYLGTVDFSLAPQIGLNRVLKTGNAEENITDYYPLTEYSMVDFYYPPSSADGLDWLSLKVVLKRTGDGYELVAFVRGVYTAQ